MKTKIKLVTLFLMLFTVTLFAPKKATSQGISISFQVFYDELSPYGNWVYTPDYGYAWLPNAEPGFFPYATDGYWVFTDDGWTWVSYYSWGWAPFHYGRWFVDDYYGPMWVPGYEWAPAWVIWGRSGNCYGWAPMAPGVTFAMVYDRHYHVPNNYWRFVPERDFGRHNIYNYYIDNSTNTTIINNYTVINNVREDRATNTRYYTGPDRREVERYSGRPVRPMSIKESSKPTQDLTNDQLLLYKPRVEKTEPAGRKPAPAKVENYESLKKTATRNNNAQRQEEKPVVQQKQSPMTSSRSEVNQGSMKEHPQKSQANRPEAVKQSPKENQPSKPENVKPQKNENQPVRQEAVKQPRDNQPSGKQSEVKQQKEVQPSVSHEPAKQPKQSSHNRHSGGTKQQQHSQPTKNNEKER